MGWEKTSGASARGASVTGFSCGELEATSTSADTRSGWRSANCTADVLPAEKASTGTCAIPSASKRETNASAWAAVVGFSGSGEPR